MKALINCPKCQHDLKGQCEICPYCGIVFKKYLKYHPEPNERENAQSSVVTVVEEDKATALAQLLFQEAQQSPMVYFWGRLLIFLGLIIWSWQLMGSPIESNAAGNSFLHRRSTGSVTRVERWCDWHGSQLAGGSPAIAL